MKSVRIEMETRTELHVAERILLRGMCLIAVFGMQNTQAADWLPCWCSWPYRANSFLPAPVGWQLSMGCSCLLTGLPREELSTGNLATEEAMKYKAALRLIFSQLSLSSLGGCLSDTCKRCECSWSNFLWPNPFETDVYYKSFAFSRWR